MSQESYPWKNDVLEVADLIWCAAHYQHIMGPLSRQSVQPELGGDGLESLPSIDPPPPAQPKDSKNLIDTSDSRTPIAAMPPQDRVVTPKPQKLKDNPPQRFAPVRVPDPFPLPEPLDLAKDLLPFRKRVPSAVASELDIDQTVSRTAEAGGIPVLSYQAPLQRWFDLHLLIDCSRSMDFWGDLATGIVTLFQWQGIFQDVRVWQYLTDEGPVPRLCSSLDDVDRDISSLIAPGKDRLFLVVTDTLSDSWSSGAATEQLALLGQYHPVALVHIFPRDFWQRTAIPEATLSPLYAFSPGCVNRKMRVDEPELLEIGYYPFPILNMSRTHLGTLAKFVTGGHISMQGILVPTIATDLDEDDLDLDAMPESLATGDPKELLVAFLSDASVEARELASVLAAIPLIPSVMRLAQQEYASHTRHWHLAEVFFSGLIEKSDFSPQTDDVNEAWYDFVPGIRDLLLKQANVPLITEVHRSISEFVKREFNSPRGFSAIIPSLKGSIQIPDIDWRWYFAEVEGAVMKAWGGEYVHEGESLIESATAYRQRKHGIDIQDELESQDFPSDSEVSDFEYIYPVSLPNEPLPVAVELVLFQLAGGELVLKQKTVEEVTFRVDTSRPTLKLETFPIRIAQIRRDESNWRITYKESTAKYFQESIGGNIAIEMVPISAGTFLMGVSVNENGYSDEEPQHQVNVSDFYMSRYPVTQAQWRMVASMKTIERELEDNPSRFKGDLNPIEQVSWYDAVEFCDRLSQRTGRNYRLPTEAEWEYACRAGTITPFHFGEMITTELANYDGSAYKNGPGGQSRSKTIPMTELNHANAYGLSGMHGNVGEWCLDHWHENFINAPSDGSAWLTSDENIARIRRGGAWNFDPKHCRSASRFHRNPGITYSSIGFRIVLAPR